MPTIVTNPTDPNYNAYVDEAYVLSYSATKGKEHVWEDNADKQEVAILSATAYIDSKYMKRAPHGLFSQSQPLLFPRNASYIDGMGRLITAGQLSPSLKQACAELAILFIENGSLEITADPGSNVKSVSVSVGGGAVTESTQYWTPQPASRYPTVAALMNAALPVGVSANVGQRTR